MTSPFAINGVFAAALTPLDHDYAIVPDDLLSLLDFLAQRGCHGALLLGTTGEGPSFSSPERLQIMRAAISIRQTHPDFKLLVGTGTPSLDETIGLTRAAFEIGMDAVVVLPPYYYRQVPDEGLFAWYSRLIRSAVPSGSLLLGYHIPAVTGVPFSLDLLVRLKDAFPQRFAGIKDSSGDLENARRLGDLFGSDMIVLSGNDRLFSYALTHSASGCITALANLCSLDLRMIWEAHQRGESLEMVQMRLNTARSIIDRYPPAPPLLKFLISRLYEFPPWQVRPPLQPLKEEIEEQVFLEAVTVMGAGV
jgi:4-hydroxy-tetrahydrodipicolinate synthase